MGLTGILTLDAQGDPNAEFIFQIGSALTTGTNAMVQMINGGQNCNVYWQIGSSATLGTGTHFLGSILALSSITLTTGAHTSGRLLARNGAVTLDTSEVAVCALAGNAPALSKEFNPSTINVGDVSTLTITLSNPNPSVATLTAPLVDTLPQGVFVAALPNVNTTCGGSGAAVATAGGSTLTLPAGRTIPADGICTISVDVSSNANGKYINTLAAGALVTSNGNNPAPAVATLIVVELLPPPTLGKAFNSPTINEGGVSTLTITLSNPNAAVATLTAPLIDTLPNGVVVAPIPNLDTTCGGIGAPLALAGGTTVTLPAGRTIPANGSCTLNVDVTAALAGTYVNTLVVGALVTTNGNNRSPAVAALTVIAIVPTAPTISKSFNPSTINTGGVSTLTITMSNPNPSIATLTAPLVDNLPLGVVVAAIPNVGSTCGGGGSLSASAGGSTVTLPAGRSIPANGSCTVFVDVTAALGGSYINSIPAGRLMTSNGNNPLPAIATLTVVSPVSPPFLGKSFNPATINAGGLSTLTIKLSNPSAQISTLTAALIDRLPAGVFIAQVPNASTTCDGGNPPIAVAGGTTVTLPAGNAIPANGNCTITVNVTAATPGVYINTLLAGALETDSGLNPAPAIAALTVVALIPPTLSKSFDPATINARGTSTLTITLSNPSTQVATLTAPLVDTLPAGVLVAADPNLGSTCTGGNPPVAVAGGSTVTLPAGNTIPAQGSCMVTISVTASTAGIYVNTLVSGALMTNNGLNLAPAEATLRVLAIVPVAVPTLSPLGLLLLTTGVLLLGRGAARLRTS